MTQPDPNVQPAVAEPVQPVAQPVQPGGDLPTVGTHDTVVEGTFDNAGQPVESTEEVYVATDPSDPNFAGLVDVQYTGSEVYEQDGFSFSPNEVRTVNATSARTLLANGEFKAV